ncbi:MAG: hypothetical protein GEU83_03190 [Pseudonocardiaceae bacterium]|nr:hypothetical protein [Pseudonocardiaceae bacterium]
MAAADDARVLALARDVERTTRRISAVEASVEQLQTTTGDLHGLVQQLADGVTALAPADEDDGQEAPRRLPSWLTVEDPQIAAGMLDDLTGWLGTVYQQYQGGVLPSCWLWHPAVVEELWWLRQAHRAAYDGRDANWRDVGDWHDRQRPGVARRIREAIGGCELARHVTGGDRAQPTDPTTVPLAAHHQQLAQQWATARRPPEPTDTQLGDAGAHDHPRTRSGR